MDRTRNRWLYNSAFAASLFILLLIPLLSNQVKAEEVLALGLTGY